MAGAQSHRDHWNSYFRWTLSFTSHLITPALFCGSFVHICILCHLNDFRGGLACLQRSLIVSSVHSFGLTPIAIGQDFLSVLDRLCRQRRKKGRNIGASNRMSASGNLRRRKSIGDATKETLAPAPTSTVSPAKNLVAAPEADAPRWLSRNPSKRDGEIFFVVYTLVWVTLFGVGIVWTGVYNVRRISLSFVFLYEQILVPKNMKGHCHTRICSAT